MQSGTGKGDEKLFSLKQLNIHRFEDQSSVNVTLVIDVLKYLKAHEQKQNSKTKWHRKWHLKIN